MTNSKRTCTRCVLNDSTDSSMTFDDDGVCNYCTDAYRRKEIIYYPNESGQKKLDALVTRLKKEGEGRKYDCMMGISGGLDSAYLAYIGYTKGLRILGVHIDDGFDTDIATDNINKLCTACSIDLVTVRPDAKQYNDITRAFFLAEVPDVAIPQDNILFAELYNYARKYGVRTFLSGGNFALESILQRSDNSTSGVNAFCMSHIRDIHRKFGSCSMNKLRFMNNYQRLIDRYLLGIKSVRPLNYVDYNRNRAINELKKFCGFEYYEAKHCENILTKVIQLYWMPKKFGYDKRTSHFSSMIVSGQMTRNEALDALKKPICDADKMNNDINLLLSKLSISRQHFDELVSRPGKKHTDYKVSKSYLLADMLFHNLFVRFKG